MSGGLGEAWIEDIPRGKQVMHTLPCLTEALVAAAAQARGVWAASLHGLCLRIPGRASPAPLPMPPHNRSQVVHSLVSAHRLHVQRGEAACLHHPPEQPGPKPGPHRQQRPAGRVPASCSVHPGRGGGCRGHHTPLRTGGEEALLGVVRADLGAPERLVRRRGPKQHLRDAPCGCGEWSAHGPPLAPIATHTTHVCCTL